MTLRTITFDDSTHKLVPIQPTIEWQTNLADIQDCVSYETIKNVIAAAPEYQDKIADLESQDFYEVMQAYRHDNGTGSETFEAVKQWLRNPVYEYQDIAQSVVEENGKLRKKFADKSAWDSLLNANQDTKKDE